MKNLTQDIATVSSQMTSQINADADLLGADLLTPSWFYMMLDVVLESNNISFENDNAKSFFASVAIKGIKKEAYRIVFPLSQMDENGNYITDESKWV